MKRDAIKQLEKWKNKKKRKPLIIRGARQVGKTWIMKEFGKTHYKKIAYISMDENERMESTFREAFDIERIILSLEIEVGFKIDPMDTLIILDEIQEIPRALKSLKYFYEQAPQYHLMAAGSLLGIALHEETSCPVGKVDFIDLYPLTFNEFLAACGQNQLVEIMKNNDFEIIKSFKSKIIDYLRYYYFVGGMPEVVASFSEDKDFSAVREIQNELLAAYENDFSKHAPKDVVTRIRMLWRSFPRQLAKENSRFIYGLIREGARAREYEVALTWLLDIGVIYKVNRIDKPDFPLNAYEDTSSFKLFMLDIGLLGAMAKLNVKILLDGNKLFEEFKGSLTEQYVMQQLVVNPKNDIFYWTSKDSKSEIDFVVQMDDKIIPLEVKAEENLQAKSLKVFVNKYHSDNAVRTSMSDYRKQDWMINYPLYSIENLNAYYDKEDLIV